MIVVDSSVWIDYLREVPTRAAEWLDLQIDDAMIAVPDLVLAEALQGCDTEREFNAVRRQLSAFLILDTVEEVAIEAARNFRILRARGVTVRKTIDALIATRCILDGLPLLYSDRDFDPFVTHLGLIPAFDAIPGVN